MSEGGVSPHSVLKAVLALGMPKDSVYVVGGMVRDLVLGKEALDQDLDLTVEGDGIAFAESLAQALGAQLEVHKTFMTAKLKGPFVSSDSGALSEVDVVTCRSESYPKPGALPVVSAANILVDLKRRDFSINAMALPVEDYLEVLNGRGLDADKILDPFLGQQDIKNGIVRILHADSFRDDPTRIFRAIRYSVRLGADLEKDTEAALNDGIKSGLLELISKRRIFNELVLMLEERDWALMIERLRALQDQALSAWFDFDRMADVQSGWSASLRAAFCVKEVNLSELSLPRALVKQLKVK